MGSLDLVKQMKTHETNFAAIRVKYKCNGAQSIFSRNSSSRPRFWQSLGIFDLLILHTSKRNFGIAALTKNKLTTMTI